MVRLAIIKKEKCKPKLCQFACRKVCPVNMMDSKCIYEENDKAVIDEILCSGCGICPKHCPFDAITIINLPEALNKSPIHQYGKNGFRVFDLPFVQKNSIVGIVGRNGIGKSSVINILSNNLKANFGKVDSNLDEKIDENQYFDNLNSLFKGCVLQNYFDDLRNSKIKISYKPQQIQDISKVFKGEVLSLFLKVNSDKDKIVEISKKVGIDKVLNRDIKVLSGGELQRVAICACLLKDESNFFIFDEITNYLDIYQRLNSSKVIKEFVENKTTLIVEHDLVVLDFLVDFIHIMYGKPSAFGTLTGIKSAKVGINNYLEGFSKEENVRFRDKPIVFDKESVGEAKRVDVLAKWEEDQVVLGDFKLNIEKGDIKKGEIIGIIGRNGLGKTTFVNHIAKTGFFKSDIFISYKKQLIQRCDDLVLTQLSVFKNFTDNFYEVYVLEPLNIKPLLEKQIDSLSGGELQRFAIAKCLLEDADLYLLDEPTAFLDIEDRLKIAKVIKNFMEVKERSAFIIDHDVVFMDYLSDKLEVFLGESSVLGIAKTPLSLRDGMNLFLKELNITFRRDQINKRPRVNKLNSVKDSKQKQDGEYYFV